ncbi:hypothetical protein [Lysobacter gummosus]|uniref:hypothetical protein n=1 Tax=Lysobacter gummosus TaxID=262324 RepID=UPI0036316D0D
MWGLRNSQPCRDSIHGERPPSTALVPLPPRPCPVPSVTPTSHPRHRMACL